MGCTTSPVSTFMRASLTLCTSTRRRRFPDGVTGRDERVHHLGRESGKSGGHPIVGDVVVADGSPRGERMILRHQEDSLLSGQDRTQNEVGSVERESHGQAIGITPAKPVELIARKIGLDQLHAAGRVPIMERPQDLQQVGPSVGRRVHPKPERARHPVGYLPRVGESPLDLFEGGCEASRETLA